MFFRRLARIMHDKQVCPRQEGAENAENIEKEWKMETLNEVLAIIALYENLKRRMEK